MTTEYGARIIQTGNVYLHGTLTAVTEFMAEYGHISPLALVTRWRDGDTTGPWEVVPSIERRTA